MCDRADIGIIDHYWHDRCVVYDTIDTEIVGHD